MRPGIKILWILTTTLAVLATACSQAHPIRVAASQTNTAAPRLPTISLTTLPPAPTPTPTSTLVQTAVPEMTAALTATSAPSATATITPTITPDVRLPANMWQHWPVLPTLSARAAEIYRLGQSMGNDPHSFSRIGDCQSEPEVFMGVYDDPSRYTLHHNYLYLKITIEQFAGSFARSNVTAWRGFGVASVFSPLHNDPKVCTGSETPLECEYRLHKPILVFISMGTNWCKGCTAKFEEYLRKIVDFTIQHGVVPILSTKADNMEGDNSLNEAVARVAYEYDVPMWNFWRAVQYLPNHGLEADNIYLTVDGWNERGFSGLQTLDLLWTALRNLDN